MSRRAGFLDVRRDIETWINYKRERELRPVQLRPHPYEFFLY